MGTTGQGKGPGEWGLDEVNRRGEEARSGGSGVLILLAALGGRRRSAREEPPAARIALARIEDLRAAGGETAAVPVTFRLTVAHLDADATGRVTDRRAVEESG